MSLFKRIELYEPYYSPFCVRETSFFGFPSFIDDDFSEISSAFDLLNPSSPFDTITDLVQIDTKPSLYTYKRVIQRKKTDLALQTLCDRVAALESSFDKLVKKKKSNVAADRKYTWTMEIKGPVEKKYTWMAEIKGAEKKKKTNKEVEKKKVALPEKKKCTWTAEIKDHKGIERKYKFKTSTGDLGKSEKKEKPKIEKKCETRVVEIEDLSEDDHRIHVLRQAFAKRAGAIRNNRGKQKELSPEDAALMIQITFRAYVIRRSKALRALRELAIAKAKLKELRALFNNFSYRRHISLDAEERQKFTEKIIVLLLTVDSIEGVDLMVRAAKRSMVDELEAMLDVVDPQPLGKSLSMRRRTFDMPDGVIQKEIAQGVAEVVQMLQQEESSA